MYLFERGDREDTKKKKTPDIHMELLSTGSLIMPATPGTRTKQSQVLGNHTGVWIQEKPGYVGRRVELQRDLNPRTTKLDKDVTNTS